MNALSKDILQDTAIVSGAGNTVILLHGSASSKTLWSGLRGAIDQSYCVVAPDMPGYERDGRAAPRSMDAIVRELAPRILQSGEPVHLVGHDFGAVVAMEIAARYPGRVSSLTMIEPVATNVLLRREHIGGKSTKALRTALAMAHGHIRDDDDFSAMEALVDFWNGKGAWMKTPFQIQRKLTAMARAALRDMNVIAAAPMSPVDLAGIVCPTLLITGAASPEPMASIAGQLVREIPFIRHEEVAEAGHFVHLTHPHVTDTMIREFIARVDARWHGLVPMALAG